MTSTAQAPQDPVMNPQQFPLLRAAARRQDWFDDAVRVIAEGTQTGAIYNSVLQDAKRTLSSAVHDGWRKHVSDPFFWARNRHSQSQEVQDLYSTLSILGLHDIIAASKKLQKRPLSGEAMNAMRTIVAEALPIAQAVSSLKDKVIKGRIPRSTPAPINTKKSVKTCPCCFRSIAVMPHGNMAHHGYHRPGYGFQTASCPGVNFPPLEVSNAGLVWLISRLTDALDQARSGLAGADDRESIPLLAGQGLTMIARTDPKWAGTLADYKSHLAAKIKRLETEIPILNSRLDGWKPE